MRSVARMKRPQSLLFAIAAIIAAGVVPASATAGQANGHRDTTLAVYGDAPYFDKTAGSGDQKLVSARGGLWLGSCSFEALTGLAVGLALKELRYAADAATRPN